MLRKNPRWILATILVTGVLFIATIIALVVTLTTSASAPKAWYAGESAKGESAGAGDSSFPTVGSTTNVRAPTTVRPSPAPSPPPTTGRNFITQDLWPSIRNVTTTNTNPPTSPTSTPTIKKTVVAETIAPTTRATSAKESPVVTPVQQQPTNTTTKVYAKETTSIWYGIGDIPYSPAQADTLELQMRQLARDAEFVIHVGDLRLSADTLPCLLSEYQDAANRMMRSHAPVFVILGDNDWNDCPDPDEGLKFWKSTFVGFESKHWNHTFQIERQENREENFAFVHKRTLFMGLNLIGGLRISKTEWEGRLKDQANWTMELIQRYRDTKGDIVGRIVIFGHANPNFLHNSYFQTLKIFIQQDLNNEIPILYLNGDKHEWSYDEQFYDQPSFLRIMVTGKGVDPPLKVVIDSAANHTNPVDAFAIDRMLSL